MTGARASMAFDLAPYLALWQLTPDGAVIETAQARLMPTRRGSQKLMLKLALTAEELAGFDALIWWKGNGAVQVLNRAGPAILMPRAETLPNLAELARTGQDDLATTILCNTAAKLHQPSTRARPTSAQPLSHWFRDLRATAADHGGIFRKALTELDRLLAEDPVSILLHGDLHHENTLFFPDGWAAIDAKGLIGPAELDYAVLFANPDLSDPSHKCARLPGVAARRLGQISALSGHDSRMILRWLLAWAGLSASWFLQDEPLDSPRLETVLFLAEWSAGQLGR